MKMNNKVAFTSYQMDDFEQKAVINKYGSDYSGSIVVFCGISYRVKGA